MAGEILKQFSKEIDEFRVEAASYCRLIETVETLSVQDACPKLEHSLARICGSAMTLPFVEATDEDAPEIDHKKVFWEVFPALGELFGARRYYGCLLHPLNVDNEEPVAGDLADDLADIYCDLRKGLESWPNASPEVRQQIVWDWKFDFDYHWGVHATEAIGILHALRVDLTG